MRSGEELRCALFAVAASSINGRANVMTLTEYMERKDLEETDFFCRFHYDTGAGHFVPDSVAVYCVCEMPYNPDHLMMECEKCEDW